MALTILLAIRKVGFRETKESYVKAWASIFSLAQVQVQQFHMC